MEHRITFEGSLDMAAVARFTDEVQKAAVGHNAVVVDFTGLDFIDSTGVRSLVILKQQMTSEGKVLRYEGFGDHIVDILDILGIREMILET